ncbi:hypothetical protein OG229_02340 [Streptomyces platensis]|uniref:hypothetical protein n=1 Tax=Streptomyces platensis TaxID=58346 RepID=UPI002E1626B5|nr:hypothetical protein OG229_02340 [Streptomyces platensis]
MKDHNRPDHRIAGTEHATLRFADGTETRIADWQIIEDAPTSQGHVYQTLRGWIANTYADTRDQVTHIVAPAPNGPARLLAAALRGREPLGDLDVDCNITTVGQPYPNTWDHPGYLFEMTWQARQIND